MKRKRPDEALLAQMPEVTLAWVGRLAIVVLQIARGHDPKRADDAQRAGSRTTERVPDRDQSEIEDWAREHDLPYFDGHVHFPDARIEYEEPDGRWDHIDIEVVTLHYRGAHGAAVSRSGFSTFRGSSARTGSEPFDPDYASELFR